MGMLIAWYTLPFRRSAVSGMPNGTGVSRYIVVFRIVDGSLP
jgi:hypothetical protein